MKRRGPFDWMSAVLFAGVAALAFLGFAGGKALGDGWSCPPLGDPLTRLTGTGLHGTPAGACSAAWHDATVDCATEADGRPCCRFDDCRINCWPRESPETCLASIDAWPQVKEITLDDGGDGGDGGSGSGD